MLKITDKNNKVKFILRDEADEPDSIDDLILAEESKNQQGEKDASPGDVSKKKGF